MHSLHQFVENLRILQIYYIVRYAISTSLFGTPARCRALINLVGPRSYGFEDRSYRRIVRQRYYINFRQIIDASRVRTYNHACFTYVTAFKDRKLYQLSYDIMYDGFSHFRVFPCLVIIHTTNNPYSLCQFTMLLGNILGLSLMSLPNSRRGTFKL